MDGNSYSIKTVSLFVFFLAACSSETPQEKKVFPETSQSCSATAIPNEYVARWKDGSYTIEKSLDREDLLREFVRPNIEELELVEPNYQLTLDNSITGTMDVTSAPPPEEAHWGQDRIKLKAAWDANIYGNGVTIAVIDTGVDVGHSLLQGRIFENLAEKNGVAGVDDDGNGFIDDVGGWNFSNNSPVQQDCRGHGTHVSGIIAAKSESNTIQGLAPKAKILPIDFMSTSTGKCGPTDKDNEEGGTTSDAIKAIQYAQKMKAQIINASWGGGSCSLSLKTALQEASDKGILIVVAAGNERLDIQRIPRYPASYDLANQITVGASTQNDVRAGFSNYGTLVHVVAPGRWIWSAFPGEQIARMDGTSMAAPFVAGQAALIWSKNLSQTATQIKQKILGTVRVGTEGAYVVSTKGEIKVDSSLGL